MNPLEPFIHRPRIAYFSMEIALQSDIPTYAGGLGVLAGDTLRTAADLELPLVGITLISRRGYFRQALDAQGRQTEQPDPWDPQRWMVPLEAKIAVPVADRMVWVQGWLYVVEGVRGYKVPVVLLDTDLPENTPADREISHSLYGDGEDYRLKQEIVLGIGGARLLQALGFRSHTYHMNEGHSALLALELLRRYELAPEDVGPGGSIYDVAQVRERCLFTTHTPVEAGHDQFDYDLVESLLDDFVDRRELKMLAGEDRLNMTRLALNLSGYVNGVAKKHAEVSNSMFPGHRVHAVTNGIHPPTWASDGFARLYDTYVPDWRHESSLLVRADQIPDDKLWQAHVEAKQALIGEVKARCGVELEMDSPIVGFARRMTAYKRPDLLFSDIERLTAIAQKHRFQIVLAGKAHPHDATGKQLIERIHGHLRQVAADIPAAFLPNYDMELGRYLVGGSDVWLNTPLRPLEASGTSGMKAALNGVPHLSVLDGWWMEGCMDGVTGWAIGERSVPEENHADAASLYDLLENTVLPLYYTNRSGWIQVMKGAITKNASYFNSYRMMRRYAAEAYIR
jgi:starch phosphorylase